MTRIASYGLYQCADCLQVHIKPLYGSISIHIPLDAFIDDSQVVTCKGCGVRKEVSKFVYKGMRSKQNSYRPNIFEKIAIKFGLRSQLEELDVRKLYPKLLD